MTKIHETWKAEQVQTYDHSKLHIITGNLMAFLSYLKMKVSFFFFSPIVFTYMINVSIKTIPKYHSYDNIKSLDFTIKFPNIITSYIQSITYWKFIIQEYMKSCYFFSPLSSRHTKHYFWSIKWMLPKRSPQKSDPIKRQL